MRIGFVGCGDAARTMGLATRFVRGLRVSAVVDPNAGRRSWFERRFAARGFDDWRTLLAPGIVDAVYVAVPHDAHRELALAYAAAGLPVLLEKPLAASFADAQAIASAQIDGARIAVNYQYRYDPRVAQLVDVARSGGLGPVSYVHVTVPWYRDERYFTNAAWHASRERSGGGTLLTQGSHALDIAILATGGAPTAVAARTYRRVHRDTEVEDLAYATVETSTGVPVSIVSSMVSRPPDRLTIAVYGRNGSIVWRGPARSRLRGRGVRVRRPFVATELHAYVASLAGFRDWAAGGGAHRCRAADALNVMRAVDAAYRSASDGCMIDVRDAAGAAATPSHARDGDG